MRRHLWAPLQAWPAARRLGGQWRDVVGVQGRAAHFFFVFDGRVSWPFFFLCGFFRKRRGRVPCRPAIYLFLRTLGHVFRDAARCSARAAVRGTGPRTKHPAQAQPVGGSAQRTRRRLIAFLHVIAKVQESLILDSMEGVTVLLEFPSRARAACCFGRGAITIHMQQREREPCARVFFWIRSGNRKKSTAAETISGAPARPPAVC